MSALSAETRRSILTRLETAVPAAIFQTWCRNLEIEMVGDNAFEVPVPNAFYRDWLEREIRRPLEEAFRLEFGRVPELAFCISDSAGAMAVFAPAPPPKSRGAEPAPRPAAPPAPPKPAGGSDLMLNPAYTFDAFVEGPTNRMALAAARSVADGVGAHYNPFFVHGGVGLGKTHLLQGICHAVIARNPHARILYLSCENFVNEYIAALGKGRIEDFRRRMRGADVLVIDDVHFLAGKDSSQEEFFHTFNALHLAQRRIVLSSDSGPKEIRTLKEQLVSRFLAGFEARIDPPTFEMRVAILRRKAELKQRGIPEEVLSFIASTVDTNIRELEGAVNKLIAYASLSQRPVDLDLAREALKDATAQAATRLGIPRVQEIVARYYGKKVADLRARTWTKSTSKARQIAMFLCREMTAHSLSEIGSMFGGKDHSTVVYALRRIETGLAEDEFLKTEIESLRRLLRGSIEA
ncbi:MAG TPA: chromosomal replication initiator protein DnaA [Planctomycetota bacterium]|nr:chromosomal replication initiator protein DnaA [Planctomycetota bacterium]